MRSTHIILSKRNVKIDNNNTSRHHPPTTPRVPGGSRTISKFSRNYKTAEITKTKPKKQTNKKIDKQKQNRHTDRRTQDKPTKYLNTSNKTSTYLKSRLKAECDVIGPSPPPARSSVRPSIRRSVSKKLQQWSRKTNRDCENWWWGGKSLVQNSCVLLVLLVCIVSASCVYCRVLMEKRKRLQVQSVACLP